MTSGYTSFDALNDEKTIDSAAELDKIMEPTDSQRGTMKALIFSRYGKPTDLNVLQEIQMPIPTITKDDQVLVKVLFASSNSVDLKIISGMFGFVSPKKPNHVTGCDFCGRVVAKGKGQSVRFLDIGQLVFGQIFEGNGTFAEYTLCPASNLCKVPDGANPMEIATMPFSSQAAFQAIQTLQLTANEKLLILGGGTATGMMAIQIAKNHIECSEVVVTSSREELCMGLGATSVVNYKEEKWEEMLKDHGFDAILDCVGGVKSWDLCRSEGVLKKNGRFVTTVGDVEGGENWDFGTLVSTMGKMINRKFWGALGEQCYDLLLSDGSQNLDDVSALIQSGKLKAVLDDESPFDFGDWRKIIQKEISSTKTGKLVLKVEGTVEEEPSEMSENTLNKVVESAPKGDDTKVEEDKAADNAPPADDVKEEVATEMPEKDEEPVAASEDVKVDEVTEDADTGKADDIVSTNETEAPADDAAGADDEPETEAVVQDDDKEAVTSEKGALEEAVDNGAAKEEESADAVKNE